MIRVFILFDEMCKPNRFVYVCGVFFIAMLIKLQMNCQSILGQMINQNISKKFEI